MDPYYRRDASETARRPATERGTAYDMDRARFVEVHGVRTRYFDAGSGETVLLIHGGQFGSFSSAADWSLNFDDLAGYFRVIAFDRIGQGMTDNPDSLDDYLVETAVTHAAGFIETVGLDRLHLVGHSRGGYIATKLAVEYSQRVRSLTIVDSGSLVHEESRFYPELDARTADIADVREMYRYKITAASFGTPNDVETWLDDVMSYAQTAKFAKARSACARARPRLQVDHVTRQRALQAAIASGALADIPILVMWAFNDRGAPIDECGVQAMRLIMANVPDSRMYIFNRSDHYPFREHPVEFNAALRLFIDSVAVTAPDAACSR